MASESAPGAVVLASDVPEPAVPGCPAAPAVVPLAMPAVPEDAPLLAVSSPELLCPEPSAVCPELEPLPLEEEHAARTTKSGRGIRCMKASVREIVAEPGYETSGPSPGGLHRPSR